MIETVEQRRKYDSASAPSPTELAIDEFLALVKEISGVLAVRTVGGENRVDQSILIDVLDLRSTAADRVYMLCRDLSRRYPNARLDVRVSALRHDK